jgi:osmotically-inducible protein OsmY
MQSKSNYFFISFFLSITILLSGCAVGVLGGPTSYADRRTTESQITDEKLEWQTVLKTQDIEGEFRANFVSYNQVVLITGQAPNQEIIDKILTQ